MDTREEMGFLPYQPAILWPKYLEKSFVDRTLCFFRKEEELLTTEHDEQFSISNLSVLIELLFLQKLLCFVKSIVELPFLNEIIQAGHTVFCDEGGNPLAIRLKGPRNSTRWIVQADRWGQKQPVLAFLQDLRLFFDHIGVGTQSTPGGTGQALMRKLWRDEYGTEWYQHRHNRPPGQACKHITETLVGGRSDAAKDASIIHPEVWELDQHNAYAVACRRLPSGPTYRVLGGQREQDYKTWYCKASITINKELPLGCFPMREAPKSKTDVGKLYYPTQPGTYVGMWWKEEQDVARQAGCTVQLGSGWAWTEWCEDLARWEEILSEKRRSAPNEQIGKWCKQAMVAGLGRFNLPDIRYTLENTMLSDEDVCCTDEEGQGINVWRHATKDKRPPNMPHWYSYLMMVCRLTLYQKALPYAAAEQLLTTNTDAVYVVAETDVAEHPDHDELVPSGTWRKMLLHDAQFPQIRHIKSREKNRAPGKEKEPTGRKRRKKSRDGP